MFQSAPAIAGERVAIILLNTVPQAVSIRARHCWRACVQGPDGVFYWVTVSIRARHCWRACVRLAPLLEITYEFQSAPAIAGERDLAVGSAVLAHEGFNPRPPLLASVTANAAKLAPFEYVSIRARHCWRA